MFDTPGQGSIPGTEQSSVSEGSPERDDIASTSTDATVAEYLSSLSGPARRLFEDEAWDRIEISSDVTKPDVQVKYQTLPTKKFSSSSSSTSSKSRQRQTPPFVSTVRLSSFGAEKVCPVLPKEEPVLNDSTNKVDFQTTYSFTEDPVAPYGWMTQSHLELDSGQRPDSATSDEMNDNSLELVPKPRATTSSRNSCGGHVRQSQMIRQSKGNPSFAKKVNIPIVPNLPKLGDIDGNDTLVLNRINRSASNPPVSPHKINNFVYESSPNRLILDFGDSPAELDIWSPRATSPVSGNGSECSSSLTTSAATASNIASSSNNRSQSGLMAKMKETRNTLTKTITGTMTRRKKHKSGNAAYSLSPTPPAQPASIPANGPSKLEADKKTASLSSLHQTASTQPATAASTRLNHNGTLKPGLGSVRKPSGRPPPPPASISRPPCAPPPPPPPSVISTIPTSPIQHIDDVTTFCAPFSNSPESESIVSTEQYIKVGEPPSQPKVSHHESIFNHCGSSPPSVVERSSLDIQSTLEDFKIDLSTDTEIPKTGFDFLDNW